MKKNLLIRVRKLLLPINYTIFFFLLSGSIISATENTIHHVDSNNKQELISQHCNQIKIMVIFLKKINILLLKIALRG